MRQQATAILLTSIVLALPASAAEPECDWEATACVKYMVDNLENKGWIGIELEYEKGNSPTVIRVIGGSPAEAAGLVAGDVLVSFDGVPYATATEDQLSEAKKAMVPGREVRITVRRDGEDMDLPVMLGKIPPAVLAQWIGSHLLEQHRHQFETAQAD